MFNNETGLYEKTDWEWEADWYEDDESCLYIVPLPGVVAEVDGPDGPALDGITAACRDHDRLTDADLRHLGRWFGLRRIAESLKRFNPQDGYYHA